MFNGKNQKCLAQQLSVFLLLDLLRKRNNYKNEKAFVLYLGVA